MPRNRKDIESGLLNKGFNRKEGDHSFFIYWTREGRKTAVFTKTSHNEKQISDSLLSMMAKQCRVTNKQFASLLDCSLDQNGYEVELRRQTVIG